MCPGSLPGPPIRATPLAARTRISWYQFYRLVLPPIRCPSCLLLWSSSREYDAGWGGCQGGGEIQPAPAGARKAVRVTRYRRGWSAGLRYGARTSRSLLQQFISKYCNCPVVNWLLNCQVRHLGTVTQIIQIQKIIQIWKEKKILESYPIRNCSVWSACRRGWEPTLWWEQCRPKQCLTIKICRLLFAAEICIINLFCCDICAKKSKCTGWLCAHVQSVHIVFYVSKHVKEGAYNSA